MKKITIVGSGTAGLIAALYIKKMFQAYDVKIISSSAIGIIGVGEGSTEHWREFQTVVGIDNTDMIKETDATHKYGIRFINWTKHTPDYFHSIAPGGRINKGNFLGGYTYALKNNLLLTDTFASTGLRSNLIESSGDVHMNTNQYHFDTFKMNDYLKNLCIQRDIRMIDSQVVNINRNAETGFIDSLVLLDNSTDESDFFFDATGFSRALMKFLDKPDFASYSEYLPTDSAIVFPKQHDKSGQIKPYTKATAMSSGWMFEIPTLNRIGNGYIFDSSHIDEEGAAEEASSIHGFKIENYRSIKYDAGYLKNSWQYNCVAVGLSGSFVEPLEATSIATTIQQIKLICSYLPTFTKNSKKTVNEYHRVMDSVMENILTMISLHYVSDRRDTPMWLEQSNRPKPGLLNHLLEIWNERPPEYHDIPTTGFELFSCNHFWHVAQGQGVLNKESAQKQLDAYDPYSEVDIFMEALRIDRVSSILLDHAEELRNLKRPPKPDSDGWWTWSDEDQKWMY
jgi:tryptophan halogenase